MGEPTPWTKPRKPKQDTLEYLRGFLESAEGKESPKNEGDVERWTEAAKNVAEELRYEVASVASHKVGGELVERLARLCPAASVEALLEWCEPYCGFLAGHRHSSHVLQTLVALACKKTPDESDERGSRTALRLWRALELGDATRWLEVSKDWNASHVVRALTWGLAGLPVVSEARGRRNARHAHSVDDALRVTSDEELAELARRAVSTEGRSELAGLCESLAALDTATLQRHCVDPNGGPALAVLVRVVSLCAQPDQDTTTLDGDGVVEAVLELDAGLNENVERSRRVMYGLSFDTNGSVVVQALVSHAGPILRKKIVDLVAPDVREYAAGAPANYVLQTLFRRADLRDFDTLAAAVLDHASADAFQRPDRAGLASAIAETALKFPRSSAALGVASAVVLDADLEALVLDQSHTPSAIREHGARALSAALSFQKTTPQVSTTKTTTTALKKNNVGSKPDGIPAAVVLAVARDPAPWSRKLVDAILKHAPASAEAALSALEPRALFDLVADAETRHRAAPNPVARLFADDSNLPHKLKRSLLNTLKAHFAADLQRRAPAFLRVSGLKVVVVQRGPDQLGPARFPGRPAKRSKVVNPLAEKVARVANATSAAQLLPAIVDDAQHSTDGLLGLDRKTSKMKKKRKKSSPSSS